MLFAIVAVPLAIGSDLEGIVHIAVPVALVADTLISLRTRSGPVAGVFVGCNLLVVIAAVRVIRDEVVPYIRRVDGTVIALLLSSRTLAFIVTLYLISLSRHATVVRTYAYCTFMYIVQILGIMHVRELVSLLDTYTVDETTRTLCVVPDTNSTGILFADSPFVATCPTRVWEHIRINVLFASQLYVLYTLTTDLHYDITTDREHRSMAYAISFLAVIECTAVCAAAAIQFDIIAGCHELSWGIGALVLLAALSYMVRRLYCGNSQSGDPRSRNYNLMTGLYTSLTQSAPPVRAPLRAIKLKL